MEPNLSLNQKTPWKQRENQGVFGEGGCWRTSHQAVSQEFLKIYHIIFKCAKPLLKKENRPPGLGRGSVV